MTKIKEQKQEEKEIDAWAKWFAGSIKVTDEQLRLHERCSRCGDIIPFDTEIQYEGDVYCDSCYKTIKEAIQ